VSVGVRNSANTTVGPSWTVTTCTGSPDAATDVEVVAATNALQVSVSHHNCYTFSSCQTLLGVFTTLLSFVF
jgi:hypothetical protein